MTREREAALAAAPALQPNFIAKSITQQQLLKLQALRRRRLQIKKSIPMFGEEVHKHISTRIEQHGQSKGRVIIDEKSIPSASANKNGGIGVKNSTKAVNYVFKDPESFQMVPTSVCNSKEANEASPCIEILSCTRNLEKAPSTTKKRQKLHWGLDTKERWERKGNM